MVSCLSDDKIDKLVLSICKNRAPYRIAMFDYLSFINHLNINHNSKKKKECLYKLLLLFSDYDFYNTKCFTLALNPQSKINRSIFNTLDFAKTVKSDYLSICDYGNLG